MDEEKFRKLYLCDFGCDMSKGKDKTALFCGTFDKMKSRFDNPSCAPIFSMGISVIKEIKQVIFNNPATIILWADGTKTVVKCKDGDKYDKQTGFLMCYLKGIVGNKTLLKEIDKWLDDNGSNQT